MRNRPFTPRQLLCLGLASLAFGGAVRAANVTHVYGSFGGHWSSGVNALSTVVPNDSNLLLGFSVNGVTYSSGLDDASLTSHNVVFSPQVFRALPVNNPPPAGAALVGIASHWGGINQVTAGGAGEVPAHASRPYTHYLEDGTQGLELASAVFNLPATNTGTPPNPPLRVAIDGSQIDPAHIGDGIPDIVVTQMGAPGSSDRFQFYDAAGQPLGTVLAANFALVPIVGRQRWVFYNAANASASFGTNGVRDVRLIALDFAELGITAAMAPRIAELRQTLSGAADPAFIAYNAASLPVVLPQLSLDKTPQGFVVPPQANVFYQLTVNNRATVASKGTLTVTDTLPAGVTFVSASSTGWACAFNAPTLSCTSNLPVAAQSSAAPIDVTLTAPSQPGLVAVPAQVSGGGDPTCPADARCQASASIQVAGPELALTKTIANAQLKPGDTASYTLSARNGSSLTSTSGAVTVSDTLPTGLTATAAAGAGWTCTLGQTITCTNNQPIAPQGAATDIVVSASVDASAQGNLVNSAEVSGGGDAGCPADPRCQASASATVTPTVPATAPLPVPGLAWPALLLTALGLGVLVRRQRV